MIVRNLSGIYTGEGFKTKRGRNIEKGDDGLIKGPVDIRCQGQQISEIGHNLVAETEEMIIDGSDKIATAAFVDSHTHGLFSGNRSFEYFIRW